MRGAAGRLSGCRSSLLCYRHGLAAAVPRPLPTEGCGAVFSPAAAARLQSVVGRRGSCLTTEARSSATAAAWQLPLSGCSPLRAVGLGALPVDAAAAAGLLPLLSPSRMWLRPRLLFAPIRPGRLVVVIPCHRLLQRLVWITIWGATLLRSGKCRH